MAAVVESRAQVCLADQDQEFDSCTGYFYDSGGPLGNYGNNEDFHIVLCPAGGAGSGASSSIRFTEWVIAGGPGPGDWLEVRNGNGGGALLATGTASVSLAGQTFTSTDLSGCLTFDWRSDAAGVAGGWKATIVTVPAPGLGSVATVCSNDAPFDMRSQLGGDPDAGGTWTDPNGQVCSHLFNPASNPSGNYTYTQSGAPFCPDASAVLTVVKVNAPNPGISGNATLCANGAPVQLINFLGGAPDNGGTWSGPSGAFSGTFDPAASLPGIYTYTVDGVPPCGSASATVSVVVNQPANAGTAGTAQVCSNGSPIQLFDYLGGSPQPIGAWTGPGGLPVSGTYSPGFSTPGVYTYTVPGIPPCASALSTVTVLQTTAPNAGVSRSITVCSTDASFALLGQLGGTPDAGGVWTGPSGPVGPTFDPSVDAPGVYTYTVAGSGPCATAAAALTITVHTAPWAGTSAAVTLCSTDGAFNLFGALGGAPQVGGTWRDPANAVHSGTFTPGVSQPGTYTYTVTGLAPCAPSSATVTVAVNTAPRAGSGGSFVRCSNDPPVDLFGLLTGNADLGGAWVGPAGPMNGTFVPGVSPPGNYTYTVLGQAPCTNASAVISMVVNPAPNAGIATSITVCGNAAPFPLAGQLGGSPDAGGAWAGPLGSMNGVFDPAASPAGTYTYTVNGLAPCAPAMATVVVSVAAPPNPGTSASITVCSSDSPVDLFGLLGGAPQPGGTWTRPNGTAHSGTYLPGSEPGGNYTYTVQGVSPCGPLSAVVLVNRVIAPNAGVDGTITVCSTNGAFPLLNVLGGNPNGSGTWLGPGGAPASGTFTPGTSVPGRYTYVVPGSLPCANDTAFATVVVNQAPNAGSNSSVIVCSNAAPFALVGALGGTPDGGGSWTRPNGTAHSGTFTPGTSQPGGYTYTVAGLTPCLSASAVVTVSVSQQPDAGADAAVTRCSNQQAFDLFAQLGGSPSTGGTWTGPSGPSSALFIPGVSAPGAYVYTVAGAPPCANASATVNVTINPAPNAGGNGSITVCQGTPSVDLFTALVGPYDAGGAWTETGSPTGQLSGNFFNCGSLPPGSYGFRYEVAGNGSCQADHADVTVTIAALLNAGSSGTLAACNSNAQVNLFNGLGGAPQQGGQWLDLGGTNALSGQFFNATLVSPGSYQFRYRLLGALSCSADSSTVTVNVVAAPNAGISSTYTTCDNAAAFPLFPLLGGNPQSGGQWRRGSPSGPGFSGTYNPAVDNPGIFYYVVNGQAPCPPVNASVTINEEPAPIPGTSGSRQVCSSDAPFSMTAALGGAPAQNGQWYFNSQAHGPVFIPGLDAQGVYEYRVTGQVPCSSASAFLTVGVTQRANAGCNSAITVCSGDGQFLLFNALTCNPDNGGFWLGPTLAPHTGTFIPGTSAPGDYLYIVPGAAPCANDTALVSVFVNPSPNAGCSGPAALCAGIGSPSVNLIGFVGCSPDPLGTWVGPSPGNPPFSGVFIPGVSAPGLYTYRVVNSCGTASASVSVSVNNLPNAGCSRTISKCSDSPAFDMTAELGCSPSFSGAWTGPLPATTVVSAVFTPGLSAPGTYVYTVAGTGACPSASATLSVNVYPAPAAGINAALSVCRSSGSVDLFGLLGPTAQAGGTWTFNGQPHSGILQPSIDASGTYVYTVSGTSPCVSSQAFVNVVIYPEPNAGNDGLVQTCSSSNPFQLIDYLTGSPQLNGLWYTPSGAAHSGIFLPGINPGGVYKYKVPGNAGCSADSSYVTVIQYEAAHAGGSAQVSICSSAAQFALFPLLVGAPQTGGEWFAPNGAGSSGIYIPGVSQPGVYKYRITSSGPCPSDSAFVTVFESAQSNAGISTLAALCSSQGPVPLASLLGGLPSLNGSWTFSGIPHGAFIDPAVDAPGAYVYTVPGAPPCPNAASQVVVTITPASSAGTNGAITSCVGATAIPLFNGLGGSPTPGGSWSTACGAGSLLNGIFDATGLSVGGSCTFTYAQAANGPCPASSATVALSMVEALDAGDNGSRQACRGELVNLFAALAGAPQAGGYWTNIDGAPAGSLIAGVFNTGLVQAGTTWRFDHILPGNAQCSADTARVTVLVISAPFAGCDGGITVCSNFPPINLGTGLSCGPDAGGQWFGPTGAPHAATVIPATSQPGVYQYVVTGTGACPADTARVTLNITAAPVAGASNTLAVCSTGAPVNLFGLLGPNAQAGGSWTYTSVVPPVAHSGVYNPAIDSPGNYVYTVQGAIPCANAQATVVVTEPQAPNAGCDASVAFCSDQGQVLMRTYLGCSAAAGGSWTYVTGGDVPHGSFFNPAVDPPGVYRYTVAGTAPCPEATALLTISVSPAANAGQSASINACVTQTSVDLFTALGPNAQAGGTWSDLGGSQALSGSVFNPSAAGPGSWGFTYTVASLPPCAAATATVTVQVGNGQSAGSDNAVTVCGSTTAFDLFGALNGSPATGGTWSDPLGTGALLANGTVNVSLMQPGVTAPFVYSIVDPSCGLSTAVVQVTAAPFPVAGTSSSITLCSTGSPVDLFAFLGGAPDAGGAWTSPSGGAHTGTFAPGTDAPGAYTYRVTGNPPCPDAFSTVTVSVSAPPDAGTNGQLLACDTVPALDLITGLLGSPQAGGIWQDLNSSGALSGGSLDTRSLTPGDYFFRYTVTAPGCTSATAVVKVTVVSSPRVIDPVRTCIERDRTYTVSFTITGGDAATYQVQGLAGTLSSAAPYVFTSAPIITSQDFTALVSDGFACAIVRLEGNSPCAFAAPVMVPESFSPNGDGVNEQFIIPGIEGYPANKLSIFNRWGGRMFEASGYDNRSVVWDGTSSNGPAPSGTYFYVLDLGNGAEAMTGFIYLNR